MIRAVFSSVKLHQLPAEYELALKLQRAYQLHRLEYIKRKPIKKETVNNIKIDLMIELNTANKSKQLLRLKLLHLMGVDP